MYDSRDFAAECVSAQHGCKGIAPAMGYVPWHDWENIFDPHEALKCGTAFPSLNLPFIPHNRKGAC